MSSIKPVIVIVDDERRSLESLQRNLDEEFTVLLANNTADAEQLLSDNSVQILLCDQRMPDKSGVQFLTEVREQWPEVIRIIISGYSDADDIISGLNEAGIYQYITKPWEPEKLVLVLRNAMAMVQLQRQNELLAIELRLSARAAKNRIGALHQSLRKAYDFDDGIIRGKTSPINSVCETLARIAPFDLSVLISGESGTGKELVARSIHYNSPRWDKPFVVQNCSSMPQEVLEAELFGCKKGSFPRAVQDHVGLFERAAGGTLFLDEIGETTLAFQVRLLRVLQDGELCPVGSSQARKVDVRVLASSQKNLEEEVQAGRFRKDLYFRLAGVCIQIPPLRERREDILFLANFLLTEAAAKLGKAVAGFTPEALSCMKRYCWPGNVREMQNEIERMLIMAPEGQALQAELLSSRVLLAADLDAVDDLMLVGLAGGTLKERMDSIEVKMLREALIRHRWNKSKAARELGLSRVGLRGKLDRYGLEKDEDGSADLQDVAP